jgi:hypothetical protein
LSFSLSTEYLKIFTWTSDGSTEIVLARKSAGMP